MLMSFCYFSVVVRRVLREFGVAGAWRSQCRGGSLGRAVLLRLFVRECFELYLLEIRLVLLVKSPRYRSFRIEFRG